MEEKKAETETKVTYDDRRKVLVQHFKAKQDIIIGGEVVGETNMDRTATFKDAGIKSIYKDLSAQRTKIEQTLKQIKENTKDIKELTPEQKELETNIKAINDFNKAEQMKSQIETNEKDLKDVNKDIRQIKETVGSRLKL